MTAYRSITPQKPPASFKLGRDWAIAAFCVVFAVAFGGFGYQVSGGPEMTCSRAAGTCIVTVFRGPGVVVSRRSMELAKIHHAELYRQQGKKSYSYAVAVQYQDRMETLDRYGGDEEGKKAWVDAINAFVRGDASTEERLALESGSTWKFYVGLLLAAGILRFAFRSLRSPKLTIDHSLGIVVVENSPLGEKVTYELHDVTAAAISEDPKRGSAILLRRSLGVEVAVSDRWNYGLRTKKALVERINAALADAP